MSTPGVPRADARRSRAAILRAAAELLQHRPEVSMTEVAAAAGLTRVTLYRHFSDLDALRDALISEAVGEALPDLLKSLATMTLSQALDAIARAVVGVAAANPSLMHNTLHRLERSVRAALPDELIISLMTYRRATGELTTSLPDEWVATCLRLVCLQAMTDTRDPEQVTADLAETLHRLVL